MRGKYFVDQLSGFAFGNPDIVNGWKAFIKVAEEQECELVVFIIPKKLSAELIVGIEKLIRDKLN